MKDMKTNFVGTIHLPWGHRLQIQRRSFIYQQMKDMNAIIVSNIHLRGGLFLHVQRRSSHQEQMKDMYATLIVSNIHLTRCHCC